MCCLRWLVLCCAVLSAPFLVALESVCFLSTSVFRFGLSVGGLLGRYQRTNFDIAVPSPPVCGVVFFHVNGFSFSLNHDNSMGLVSSPRLRIKSGV